MTREKIIKLAREHWHRDNFNIEYFDAVAFYHAAQAEAFEAVAVKCLSHDPRPDQWSEQHEFTESRVVRNLATAIREMTKEMK